MVGEVVEKRGGCKFLTLKNEWSLWTKEKESSKGAVSSRSGKPMNSYSSAGVGDLIVVLQIVDKAFCREIKRRSPPVFFLPCVVLPLVEVSILGRRYKLLRCSHVITEIGFGMSGKSDHRCPVEIVIPERIQSISLSSVEF